jgi:cytochrome b pre-mRNA-processing protein 3
MILGMFKKRKPRASDIRGAYEKIVAAARHPVLYARWGVPDTVDGRFDMIALHAFLAMDRLADRDFAQWLSDEFFRDMDRSLREMGAGDVTVPKKVRKMAEAFHGRAAAYRQALASGHSEAIEAAIARNVFVGGGGDIPALSAYMRAQYSHLEGVAPASLSFLEPKP